MSKKAKAMGSEERPSSQPVPLPLTSPLPFKARSQTGVNNAETNRDSAPQLRAVKKVARPQRMSASTCLERALHAKTSAIRVKYARLGLTGLCDVETQALLLRQLYLGELETERYASARDVAVQMIALGVMPDVARHDAARACQALGDVDGAVEHLEAAATVGPTDRIGFHLSTLGSLLYVSGRFAEALVALHRAEKSAGSAQPLIRAQIALTEFVQLSGGFVKNFANSPPTKQPDDRAVTLAYHELLHDPSGEGYGRFVLGEIASARGDRRAAQMHLAAFIAKVRRSRPAARAALGPEVARAEQTLGKTVWN